MDKRVLITGARGFVASHLIPALQQMGFKVVAHSRQEGDIAQCDLPYEEISHVFHLAGKTFVPDSWRDPRSYYSTNVLGTINVLEFCRKTGAALTHLSSYVYGQPDRLPISEEHPLKALNPYGHSKILAEEAAAYYHSQFGIRLTVIRPFNIYGPGQSDVFLIPALIKQALDPGKDVISVEDDRPARDFLHIRDLVRLLLATIGVEGRGLAFNAGSGLSVSVRDLVQMLNSFLHRQKPMAVVGTPRKEEVLDVRADISRAASVFGWSPTISLQTGIQELMTGATLS